MATSSRCAAVFSTVSPAGLTVTVRMATKLAVSMPKNNPYSDVPEAPSDLDLADLAQGREIEIDVGFGRGHFLLARAAARAEALLIGLEMRRKWVALVARRAKREGLDNTRIWYGDARHLLPNWKPNASFTSIYVNFPDPWWKKKHEKRRVITATSVRLFTRLLRPGGHLLVQTDVEERNQEYRIVLDAEPNLVEVMGDDGKPLKDNPVGTLSHREKKCIEAGLPVWRLYYRKRDEEQR